MNNLKLSRLCGLCLSVAFAFSPFSGADIDQSKVASIVQHLRNFTDSSCQDPRGRWRAIDISEELIASPSANDQEKELLKSVLRKLEHARFQYQWELNKSVPEANKNCQTNFNAIADELEPLTGK